LGIDDDLVMQELRGALRTAKQGIRHRAVEAEPATDVEARLVRLVMADEEARRRAREVLQPADLADTRIGTIVRTILELDAKALPVDGPIVVDALEDEGDRDLLTRIAFREEAPGGADEVDGCLQTLRKVRLKKEHRAESRELGALSRDDQTERLLKLMRLGHEMDAPHRDVTN
jgi:hypothetical protein